MNVRFLKATTKDKLILQGLLYEPDKATDKVVLHVHGMAGNFYENRFLDAMAEEFTKNGWAFLSFNNRGHDYIADFPIAGPKEKYKRIGDFREKFEECVLDIKAWIDFIYKQKYKYLVLQGHSLGCSKVVYYMAKTGDKRVKRLVLASPSDMIGIAERGENHKRLMALAQKMISKDKGEEILPELIDDWYYLSANTYVDFSERDRPIDVFNTYDKEKPSVLGVIRIPILAFMGENDLAAILPVEQALKVIESKAVKCPKFDSGIIKGAPHSYFGHENEMTERVIRWLEKGIF